jgi:hypothetical protein
VGLSALSAETLAALQSVLTERAAAAETAAADPFRRGPLPSAHALSRHAAAALMRHASRYRGEDWGKSQFYYDDATAATLATEVAALGGSVACISCPTLFRTLKARRSRSAALPLAVASLAGCRLGSSRSCAHPHSGCCAAVCSAHARTRGAG